MAVSKRTRYEVLKRDNHTCRYCGGTAPDAVLTVDHVTPVALGGSDDPSNLVAACRDCNYGKSSTSPGAALVEDVKVSDLRWADAQRRAAEILAAKDAEADDFIGAFIDAWPSFRTLPSNWEWGLRRLYEAGLPQEQMVEAAGAAAHNRGVYDRFNYFMGICWKRVTTIQEVAKQILAAEEAE
jgi:hypothetical protein